VDTDTARRHVGVTVTRLLCDSTRPHDQREQLLVLIRDLQRAHRGPEKYISCCQPTEVCLRAILTSQSNQTSEIRSERSSVSSRATYQITFSLARYIALLRSIVPENTTSAGNIFMTAGTERTQPHPEFSNNKSKLLISECGERVNSLHVAPGTLAAVRAITVIIKTTPVSESG